MEPDDTADKAASQDFRSKLAFFKSQSQQSSQTQKVEPVRKGPPPPKPVTTTTQTTSITPSGTETETENLYCRKQGPAQDETDINRTSQRMTKRDERSSASPQSERKSPQTDRRFSHKLDEELRAKIEEVSMRKSSGFSPNDMEVFQNPMCLVSAKVEMIATGDSEKEQNTLEIVTRTVKQIEKIDWPIVVVSVAGLYRTGKSYLMNRLAGSAQGFTLGDTIESTTKGIWVWCKIHPEKTNTVLMLLDTEGLGDIDRGDPGHDNKIFTLATLLCNCLVYNMKGAFDQDAVGKLTFVTEMAKNIRFKGKSSDDNSSLNLILPDFVLCLRDFSLKLSKGGKKITEDEYLELCLAMQKGKDEKFNKPRECIRKFFPQRKCFTLPVPGDGDVLENLETLEFNALSDKFKEATIRFVSYIYNFQPKELLASKPINGQMFTILATHYVTAIRHGAVPDVDDAFSAAAKMENNRVGKEAVEIFEAQLGTVSMPVPYRDIETCYTKAQQQTLNYLRMNVVHDKGGQCEMQAEMKMDKIWNEIKDENAKKIDEMCEDRLKQAYKTSMEDKIEKKVYEVAGGHRIFQRDIDKMKEDFMNTLRDFEEHEILRSWLGFLKTIKNKETQIIEADDVLTIKEKEAERKRNEENIKQMMEEHKHREEVALKEQREAMEKHWDTIDKEREKQNEKQNEKFEELMKVKLDKEQADEELRQYRQQEKEQKEKAEKEVKRYRQDEEERKNRWFFTRMRDAIFNW